MVTGTTRSTIESGPHFVLKPPPSHPSDYWAYQCNNNINNNNTATWCGSCEYILLLQALYCCRPVSYSWPTTYYNIYLLSHTTSLTTGRQDRPVMQRNSASIPSNWRFDGEWKGWNGAVRTCCWWLYRMWIEGATTTVTMMMMMPTMVTEWSPCSERFVDSFHMSQLIESNIINWVGGGVSPHPTPTYPTIYPKSRSLCCGSCCRSFTM